MEERCMLLMHSILEALVSPTWWLLHSVLALNVMEEIVLVQL
jgi:hypothetical protein